MDLVVKSLLIDPIWLDPKELVTEVIQSWIQEDSQSYGLVGSKEKLQGILSHREIIQAVIKYNSLEGIRVEQAMRDPIAYVLTPDQDPKAIISFIKKNQLSILPVVDDQGFVLGITTPDRIQTTQAVATEIPCLREREDQLRLHKIFECWGMLQKGGTDLLCLRETETQLKQLQENLQTRVDHEQRVTKITQRIRESLELETILATTVTEVAEWTGADRVLIYQLVSKYQGLVLAETVKPEWLSLQGVSFTQEVFPLEQQALYQQGRIRSIPDIRDPAEKMADCLRDFCEQWQIRAKLIVPILVQDTLWGILVAHQCSGPRSWSHWDTELMMQLSNQLGIAIYQADIHTQLRHQVEQERLFTIISQQMRETFDLQHLFSIATQGLGQLLGCHHVTIRQLKNPNSDQEGWQVLSEYRSTSDLPKALYTTIPTKDNPITHQLKQGIQVYISDASQLEDPVNKDLAKRFSGEWLITPIAINGVTWGSVTAIHHLFGHLGSPETLDLVIRMVNHLSLAISQSELYQLTRRQAEQAQLLAKVSQRIRYSLDLKEIWHVAVEEVRQLLDTDRVVIFRLNQHLIGSIVAEAVSQESFSILGQTIEDHCFKNDWYILYQQGRISQIEDIETASIQPCHAELLASLQVRANLVVPLLQGSHLWGLLIAHHCQGPKSWDPWTASFLKELASYLSIAIQQAELFQQLQSSQERYRQLLEVANEGVWLIDQEGVTTFANPYLGRMLGYTPAEMIGRSFLEFIDPEAQVIAQQNFQRRQQGIREQPDFRFTHKNGSDVWTIISTNPLFDAQGQFIGALAMVTDITDRKRFEAELWQAKEAAEAANHSKSQFLAVISHEIRTPLNAVLGMLSLLEKTQLTQQQQQFAKTIRAGGEVLLNIISDVLDLSRIEADMLEIDAHPINLKQDLKAVIMLLYPKAQEKGLQLNLNWAPETPSVILGSAQRLKQVLINLIANAIKFTDSGSVTVSIEVIEKDPETTCCHLLFKVMDTGIGIPPEQLELIFQPFQQADGSITRRYGGTGLGLTVCRRLVELMGGQINLTSQVGVGSTFSFSLPTQALPEKPVHLAEQKSPSDPLSIGKIADTYPHHILVVEDNPVNQMVISTMLNYLGYAPHQASHGYEALEYLSREVFDLILMDIEMPEMDGLTATKRIREQFGDQIYIIGLSAGAFSESRQAALDAGMNTYVTKPIKLETLAEVLQALPITATPTLSSSPLDPKALDQLKSILGSKAEQVISEMIQIFFQDTQQRLDKMKYSLQHPDREPFLWQLAHGLKGTASQLGAHRLTELARSLEINSKTEWDQLEIERFIDEIEDEFARVTLLFKEIGS